MPDVLALMRDWLDAVAMGPAEAWTALSSDEVVIRLPYAPPGVAAELRGRTAAVAALTPVWRAKERFAWRDVRILRTEEPGLLLATARSEAAYFSGKSYANTYVILTRFLDGQVIEHVEYFNPLPVMALFGEAGEAS